MLAEVTNPMAFYWWGFIAVVVLGGVVLGVIEHREDKERAERQRQDEEGDDPSSRCGRSARPPPK